VAGSSWCVGRCMGWAPCCCGAYLSKTL